MLPKNDVKKLLIRKEYLQRIKIYKNMHPKNITEKY